MFCNPVQVAYFPQRGNKRGNWFKNAGLHAGAISTPDYSPPRGCSYSSIYLYKLKWNPMGEHWMFMPEVHVGLLFGGQERHFHLGDPKLLSHLSPPPRVVTHSSWCCFPGIIPSHCSSIESKGQPGLPVPFVLVPIPLSIHAVRDKGVFCHCGMWQKSTRNLECYWVLRRHSMAQSPARAVWTGMHGECTGESFFISFFL